jgi:NTE family protein
LGATGTSSALSVRVRVAVIAPGLLAREHTLMASNGREVSGNLKRHRSGCSWAASLWMPGAVVLAMTLVCSPAGAAEAGQRDQAAERPRIGLALSGGGARGAAHIGVLKVLEEMRIPIDYLAGTSMGSIVGGLYAAGMTPEEIEHTLNTMDWEHIFDDKPPREKRSFRRKRDDDTYLVKAKPGFNDGELQFPLGAIQGQKFDLALRALTLPVASVKDFDRLHIPFRAVATDIANGEEVVIGTGDLAQAMRASMAVPGAFAPTRMDERLLVDGGISNNLPISVVREMGADVVIAVDISTPYIPADKIRNVFGITGQLTSIMTRKNVEQQLATLTGRDVLLVPILGDIGSADFDRAGEAVPTGRAVALAEKESLARLSLPEGVYRRHVAMRPPRMGSEPPVIDFVRLENHSPAADEVILARLTVQPGEPLDQARIEGDIARIYGLELFEIVSYSVAEEEGRTGLVVHARERAWGPNYLQFGLALSSDSRGENNWNLGVAYLRTGINPLGGEIRTGIQVGEESGIAGDWYQPLDYASRWFVHPAFGLGRRYVGQFSEDASQQLAEFRVDSLEIDVGAGRAFGQSGEGRVGYRLQTGDSDLRTGTTDVPDGSFTDSKLYGRVTVDTLDNANWPGRGQLGHLEYAAARKNLGGDTDFDQVTAKLSHFSTFGPHTVGFVGRVNATVDGDAPVQDRFRLGGFLRLSGFAEDSLSGQQSGSVALLAYRRYKPLPVLSWYLGASLEYGGVWEDRDDLFQDGFAAGSLFAGADTPIGPLYVGYGQAERGNHSLFVFLGRPF